MPDGEIAFQVREDPQGGYTARAIGYSIFTEGDDWEHLKYMMRDARAVLLRRRGSPPSDSHSPGPE